MNLNLKAVTTFLLFSLILGCVPEDPTIIVPGLNLCMISDAQTYEEYHTPYVGFYKASNNGDRAARFGPYHWHIYDPIRFHKDFKITVQILGWDNEGNYFPLEDDVSSVAFWYQKEPHQKFPELPGKEKLIVIN